MSEKVVLRGVDRHYVRGAWYCVLDVPAGAVLVTEGIVAVGDCWAVPLLGTTARRMRGAVGDDAGARIRAEWFPVGADQVGQAVSEFRAVVRLETNGKRKTENGNMCLECGRQPAVVYGRCECCHMAVCDPAA
jgi:hypothetical protein